MAERSLRAQPVSVANHIKARRSLIERSQWLATESGWAQSKRSAICSGKLCGGFIIFGQCCPCERRPQTTCIHPSLFMLPPPSSSSCACSLPYMFLSPYIFSRSCGVALHPMQCCGSFLLADSIKSKTHRRVLLNFMRTSSSVCHSLTRLDDY